MTAQAAHRRANSAGTAILALALLCLLLGLTAFCGWVFLQRMAHLYRDSIYPNVYALGVDLGGMRPDDAATALKAAGAHADTGSLVLTDGGRRWSYPWSIAGLNVDAWGTAQAAFAVGREGTWQDTAGVWLNYHDVLPRFVFDITQARAVLAELDLEVSRPPVDPAIRLEQGEIVIVPGEAGRVLDIANTLARLNEVGSSSHQLEIPLAFEIIEPAELETSALTEGAEVLLARRITLLAYDPLSEDTLSWVMAREQIAGWIHLVPGERGDPTVDINQYAIRDTLIRLADALGDGRGFRYDDAAARIFKAFDAGEEQLWLYLTHPERTYIVQAGDTLTSLSAKFGMPPGVVAE
ncbi:MAG: peptidoglycan binding domain-containing protein, partial [Anaerolineae bacterium]|nr:peptidoglycan binding domain-containing protein [Anaerolineae bacterium]